MQVEVVPMSAGLELGPMSPALALLIGALCDRVKMHRVATAPPPAPMVEHLPVWHWANLGLEHLAMLAVAIRV